MGFMADLDLSGLVGAAIGIGILGAVADRSGRMYRRSYRKHRKHAHRIYYGGW